MSKNIILEEKNLLGKGRERACYINPNDNTKVIKVVYRTSQKLNQNELESEYLKFLEKKKIPLHHLSKCYGFLDTNLGKGYIFDRVLDYTGKGSISFKDMVLNEVLSSKVEKELLEELKDYLLKNNIIFVDIALSNIFCQEVSSNHYKLIISDGIGGKRTGLKSKLYLYFSLFTKYKVNKQWKKLFARYYKVINQGIKNGTRKEI